MNETPPPPPEGSVPPPPPPVPPAGEQQPPADPPPPPPPGGTQSTPPGPYPVDLSIEYQDRELNRTTTFFRIVVAIPILIILGGLTGGLYYSGDHAFWGGGVAAGLIVMPTALMLIFQEKYPRWWFDFNKELTKFILRVDVFLLLIDDRYPSTTDEQGVQLKLDYPNVEGELSRFMPIIKWLLAIPHYVILFFLGIGAFFGTIYAWFVILFTGRYPKDVFDYVSGVLRWATRVHAYAFLLVTDEYPPFRLES